MRIWVRGAVTGARYGLLVAGIEMGFRVYRCLALNLPAVHPVSRLAVPLEIDDSSHDVPIEAEFILVACGTRAARRDDIPFDHPAILDADRLYDAVEDDNLAHSSIVVGGGVIGMEYAAMGAALEMKVTVIEAQEQILGFLDRHMVEALTEILEQHGVTFRLGEKVASVSIADDDGQVRVSLEWKGADALRVE